MQNRSIRVTLTLLAAAIAASMIISIANAGAQNTRPAAPRTEAAPQKPPDFSGVWLQAQPGGTN